MTKDARKNLEYRYNLLNLLSEVKVAGTTTSKAKYTYAADGTKLAVRSGSNGFDYRGSFIYNATGSLESVSFGDGRIVKNADDNSYLTNYHITDHLGSVRVILDASGGIQEQNDYYAFGGKHSNENYEASTTNRFQFNGKEVQTTGDVGFLDYGARMYDSEIGRWFG